MIVALKYYASINFLDNGKLIESLLNLADETDKTLYLNDCTHIMDIHNNDFDDIYQIIIQDEEYTRYILVILIIEFRVYYWDYNKKPEIADKYWCSKCHGLYLISNYNTSSKNKVYVRGFITSCGMQQNKHPYSVLRDV